MSYNIDSVDCLILDAYMKVSDVRDLLQNHADKLPEICFLNELRLPKVFVGGAAFDAAIEELRQHDEAAARRILDKAAGVERIKLSNLWWQGEGSGRAFDFFKEHVAPLIQGKVEAVLIWERGDSLTGLRIKDGLLEEMDVEQKLIPKKAR